MSEPLTWPGDVEDLARVVSAVGAESGLGSWFWLDGGGEPGGGGHSYLGIAAETREAVPGRGLEFLDGLRGSASTERDQAGPTRHGAAPTDVAPAANGFRCGWVVALGYEFGIELVGLPELARSLDADLGAGTAPALALRADTVIVFDHATGRVELRGERADGLGERLEEARERIERESLREVGASDAPRIDVQRIDALHEPEWRRSGAAYRAEVEACRSSISDGDAYVLCLTDTATARIPAVDPLALYLRLRSSGTALRGGVIAAGDRALVSASPERFLGLASGRLSTHPIKGTRPRGSTEAEDARLAADLIDDEKERAENLMIVDLMRNDLSRVCRPETVAVTDFLRVETHRHVHQLVSTIAGELRPGMGIADAVASCFPGGSMTGAPKRRAIELLAEIERAPRGLYSGCFGWIDRAGDAELAMTIRSIELLREHDTGAAVARVGAGGGITIDSDPVAEHAERDLKAEPLLSILRELTAEPRAPLVSSRSSDRYSPKE